MEFLKFSPQLAPYFDSINREWISDMFVLEPIDEKVISNPQTYVIDRGGYIWFAKHPEHGIVGTCALLKRADGIFELTKMGVSSYARGLKVGEKLLSFVISKAEVIAYQTLFLLTNDKCQAAIHLYEKQGFVHDKEILQTYGKAYTRCNVAMRYQRKKSQN
ncbi:GNAT family N-acetyltransferase [Alteromonas sp. ASW11-130]|uniref:GNAT family N-acetyltransferase n=1 Tax=Alteromonas sp. ASW11-130 TaxID=3015775 RepID=UPI0022428F4A|nr:GNAT family N-acetyltransferase [Alteromonas sp. ASW11-130]MCW8093344.1 GNAT family N-acetyltransferase [Alteromonas sp. ASW11-130]